MGRGEMVREGKEAMQAYGITGLNKVTVFSDVTFLCNAGYPSKSVLIKQVIVYLSVCLSVYMFG